MIAPIKNLTLRKIKRDHNLNNNNSKNVLLFCLVSDGDFFELERQRDKLIHYAEIRGWNIVGICMNYKYTGQMKYTWNRKTLKTKPDYVVINGIVHFKNMANLVAFSENLKKNNILLKCIF